LFKAGDQLPVIALVDVVGKAERVPPAQMAATELNTGAMVVAIVTVLLLEQPLISV